MIKKVILFLLIGSLCISINGCWDYRSLNDLTIVSGMAIDKNENGEGYNLTFEVLDILRSNKQTGIKSKIIESEGKTIFDAIRNAKKRQESKLYFGNTQIIIISQKLAAEDHLSDTIDLIKRDIEFRETINILVSQEKTAKEILSLSLPDNPVVSYELDNIVDQDKDVTGTIKNNMLYQIYDILNSEGISLVLPAVHKVTNVSEEVIELNGLAMFKGEKLIGFLTPEESKYYLFATDNIKGGILTSSSTEEGKDNISFELKDNKTKTNYAINDNKIKISLKVVTDVYVGEIHDKVDVTKEEELNELEYIAEEKLADRITNIIKKVQMEFGTDIFGFGSNLYKTHLKIWRQIDDEWDNYFETADIEVQCKINILNTASMKK